MDVLYFLKERTRFISRFYDQARAPFDEQKRKIEDEEEPFVPPYSENDEPAFMEEWGEAETAIRTLGRACVSMLSASLQVYLETWRRELSLDCGKFRSIFKNRGFLSGYRACFEDALEVPWNNCPADLLIIEQVVQARNADQHPKRINSMNAKHDRKHRQAYPIPFFASEFEKASLTVHAGAQWWLGVNVHVDRDSLFKAIDEVEKLAGWLDAQIAARRF